MIPCSCWQSGHTPLILRDFTVLHCNNGRLGPVGNEFRSLEPAYTRLRSASPNVLQVISSCTRVLAATVRVRGASWKRCPQPRVIRRPNGLTLSCAAKAHVPKFARRDGCHVRAAARRERMSAGVTPASLCIYEALQRRSEAGPCRLQLGVRPPVRQ